MTEATKLDSVEDIEKALVILRQHDIRLEGYETLLARIRELEGLLSTTQSHDWLHHEDYCKYPTTSTTCACGLQAWENNADNAIRPRKP